MTHPISTPLPEERQIHVLRLEVIRAAIETLQGRSIHEHFPGYLHLRCQAKRQGSLEDIRADWPEVSKWLRVDGGPPNKPHYRPFSSRNRKDPSGYWYQRNLQGSYAPRSIRNTASFMIKDDLSGYSLPVDHAQRALQTLLKGEPAPAWAMASYFLRNYGMEFDGSGGHEELLEAFRQEFLFPEDDDDFQILFDNSVPDDPRAEWFEPFDQNATPDISEDLT